MAEAQARSPDLSLSQKPERSLGVSYEALVYEQKDGIGVITLNRPQVRNALNTVLVRELNGLLDDLAKDEELRVLIITGGNKFFCSGNDLKEIDPNRLESIRLFFRKLENFDRPVIAAINGKCLAGGCEMALCCDLRIAGEDAKFGFPEIRFGALAFAGATQRLPRLVGVAKAKEMHYTGEPIDAQEAYRMGLVNRLVKPESVLEEAKKLAATLVLRWPVALKMAKYLINTGMRMDLNTAMEVEAEVAKALYANPEALLEEMRKAAERETVYKKMWG
jgi:enoyl-CoA hydratase